MESNESINRLRSKCRKCQSGSSQLHLSQQDMYGSRLSVRVQESARSAWKASKQFASSVITGRVSISGCRKHQRRQPEQPADGCAGLENGAGETCAPSELELAAGQELTSVVQVGSQAHQPPEMGSRDAAASPSPSNNDLVVRVDGNNKLTIVTKFNNEPPTSGADHSPSGAAPSSASSSASDRSRCESSSSGRGTVSESGSAAPSQDDEQPSTVASIADTSQPPADAMVERQKPKRDAKGRSKLFKASKLLGSGSQLSINKFKSFLIDGRKLKLADSAKPAETQHPPNEQQQSDLESARLRCLELNQAINVASMAVATKCGPPVGESQPRGSLEA